MLSPDTIVGGRYRIVSIIGQGSYGKVYLGHDAELDRDVAIKELQRSTESESGELWATYQHRFRKEAHILSRFSHTNVVTAYGLEQSDAGDMYLILEYVDGTSLKELLENTRPLSTDQALNIAIDICQAVDAIYKRDIVHRDIKPGNVLVARDGSAKLTDFGVAQVGHETHRTQEAVGHPGTPAYKSPEQATSTGYLDQRSDLYSLGLVLYEMLTGQLYVRNHLPPHHYNPQVPPALDAVVMKALQENPSRRYQSAVEMLQDLERVRRQDTVGQLRIVLDKLPLGRYTAVLGAAALILSLLGIYRLASVISGATAMIESRAPATVVLAPSLVPTPTWTMPVPTATITPLPSTTPAPSPSPSPTADNDTPINDAYEPDERAPVSVTIGQTLRRSFDPAGDVDRVTFRARAASSYIVATSNLAPGVDTRIEVLVGGEILTNGDLANGATASQVEFVADNDGTVVVTILNDGEFGPDKTYDLSVIQMLPTATLTPTPANTLATSTPRPTLTRGTVTLTPQAGVTLTPTLTRTATQTFTPYPSSTPVKTKRAPRPPHGRAQRRPEHRPARPRYGPRHCPRQLRHQPPSKCPIPYLFALAVCSASYVFGCGVCVALIDGRSTELGC